MYLLIGILIVVIMILFTTVLNFKKEVRYLSKQMQESKGEYTNIHTRFIDKDIESLAKRINDLYDENQIINSKCKNVEEKLRRSIANMSHDLRTPLTSIMGYMQLIKDESIDLNDKKGYIQIVERRTHTLQTLISGFYDLSRIEGNEYKFKLKTVNLSKILCESIAQFYNDFISNNIEPIIEINENIMEIISDENAIIRVFNNLMGNMIKHIYREEYKEKNSINIRLRQESDYIITEFVNYAPSLKEEIIEKLFDRFFTIDVARSDKNTGLGLCITKALVEQLGNEIGAELIEGNLCIFIKWRI